MSSLVDAAPVRAHIRRLMATQMTIEDIAEASGLSKGTISTVLYTSNALFPATAYKALKTTPRRVIPRDRQLVDATGTHRRLQALIADGFPTTDIARRLGQSATRISQLLRSRSVTAANARRVAAIYEDLADQEGPSARAAQRGRECGWHGRAAWKPHTIDDPNAGPLPERGR